MRALGTLTKEGENVAIFSTDDVALVFEKVTKEGLTTVEKPETGPAPPMGLTIEQYYNIQTEANYQGKIQIRIIRASSMPQVDPKRIRLWQWNTETKWKEIRISFNPEYNLIVGETSHLSMFGVTR